MPQQRRVLITKWIRDIKHSIENIADNIVIMMHGARWVLEIPGGPLRKVHDYLPLESAHGYEVNNHSV